VLQRLNDPLNQQSSSDKGDLWIFFLYLRNDLSIRTVCQTQSFFFLTTSFWVSTQFGLSPDAFSASIHNPNSRLLDGNTS
jgi:hypothetical protein